MENIHRFQPEMMIGLIWFFGGLILGWILLAWVLIPEWAIRSKHPESLLYQWTINILYLHVLLGLIIGGYQYSEWYYQRKPMDTLFSSWPLILFYVVCIGADLFLIFRFFLPPFRKYNEREILKSPGKRAK